MRIKKILPYLILLLVVLCGYMLYNHVEGFSATMTCSCPTGYIRDTTNNNKCYKCSTGTYSNGACSSGGVLDVKYNSCTCSNGKTTTCSNGTKLANNKCYTCDPSNPTYNTPTLMTASPYNGTVRCTTSGSSTATSSKTAYEVTNGLFCPS